MRALFVRYARTYYAGTLPNILSLSCFRFCSLFLSLEIFIQQRLLQRPKSTRMPIQTKATTTTKMSTPQLEIFTISKNRNENNGPTSTFDDLLNSFQKDTGTSNSPSSTTTTTTTRRPQLTTFSDADDIAFLNGLVWIKSIFFFISFDVFAHFTCLF